MYLLIFLFLSLLFCLFLDVVFVLFILMFLAIFTSYLFFLSMSWLLFFILLEFSTFLVLFSMLFYGYQLEKVMAGSFFIFYGISSGMVFLFGILFLTPSYILMIEIFSLLSVFIISVSFLMKLPFFGLHFWLPKVHVESPTLVSIVLAALLLKLSCWGFFIFFKMCGMFFSISFFGLIFCSFYCLFQGDGKSLIAYSSVVHMASFMLFLLTMIFMGWLGSFLMLVGHGFVSTFLFFWVGNMFYNTLSRMIYFHNGLFFSVMLVGLSILIMFMINSGLPFTLNFMSEVYGLISIFNINYILLMFLSIYFMIGFYYSIQYGVLSLIGVSLMHFSNLVYVLVFLLFYLLVILSGLDN